MPDGPAQPVVRRTGDPRELARALGAKLEGLAGEARALAAWTLARDLLERNLASPRIDPGACHKGCHWCCHLDVEVRFADAVQLARRARADPELAARVRATAGLVAGLSPETRLGRGVPCAFLDRASGACGVYEDRPLACRAYRSRDAGWCRAVATGGSPAGPSPVIREALGVRAVIQQAMVEVTPAPFRDKGELHAQVVRLLDAAGPLPAG